MKLRSIILLIVIASALFNELQAQPPDAVEIATESNVKKANSVKKDDAEFLVSAADKPNDGVKGR